MRHTCYIVRLALAWALAVSIGGCAAHRAPSATQPTALTVPIVYSSYSHPEPLNAAQRREIDELVAETRPRAGEPWFLYVRYSREGGYRVSFFFKPTETSGAIRRGNVVYLDNDIPMERRRQIIRVLGDPGDEWPALFQYVQVSARASDPTAPPAEADLPFVPPDGISDSDLIALVEAARGAAIRDKPAAAQMPIHRIEVMEDGIFRVYFGWLAGPLNGQGRFVDLKRAGPGFTSSTVGMWLS